MYNDPGADQPVSALENANGFHIELNENALEHVSRFYQPSVNTGPPTFFEYPLSSPFRLGCSMQWVIPLPRGSRTEGTKLPNHHSNTFPPTVCSSWGGP